MFKHIKKLSNHSFIYGFGEILYKGMAIVLIPIYTRCLSTADYGIIELVRSISSILVILFPLGLDSAMSRNYFDYKDKSELKKYIFTVLAGIAGLGLLITLTLDLTGGMFFPLWMKDVKFDPYIRLTLWTSFLFVFPATYLILLQVQEKSRKYILFQLLQSLVLFGLIIYFVVIIRNGALGQIQARLWATLAAALLSGFLFSKYVKFSFKWKEYINSLKFGLPVSAHTLSWWALSLSNRLILQRYVPLSEAGIYSLGHNIGMGMEIILSSFNKAWMPFLYANAETEHPEVFAKLTKYYLAAVTLVALCLSVFAKEIIIILTTKSYYESYEIIPIIVLGYIFIGIYMMLTNQIFYKKKTHYFLFITPVSAGVSIVLNFLLIPRYGMYGAAFSTLISFIFYSALTYYFSIKVFPIPYEKKKIILLISGAVAFFFLIKAVPDYSLPLNILIKASLMSVFCILLWLSGYFSKEEKNKILGKLHWR